MNKTFCEVCREENVDFSVEIVTIKTVVKGREYEYCGLKGVCMKCGSELYIQELEDENLRIFNKLIGRLENEK